MGARTWRVWLAVGVAVVLLRLLLPTELLRGLAYVVVGGAAVVAIVVGVRRQRPLRALRWYLLAAGQGLFVAGDLAYTLLEEVSQEAPFPSVADGLYLAGYPLLALGVLALIRGRTPGRDRAGLLDAAIVSTGMGLLAWVFLMRPIADDPSLSLLERLISLAYPMGDVLLLVIVTRLLTSPGARTASFWFVVAGIGLTLAADVVYAALVLLTGYDHGLIDVLWLLGYLAWGAAALHPSMGSLSEVAPERSLRFTRRRLVLLTMTSLMAPALLAYQGWWLGAAEIDVGAIVLGCATLFLLVVARMSGLVSQVQDQAAQLEALARNDGLTGIPNRRAWDLELARELAKARRLGTRVHVALLDLDHFKRFNDEHGHQAGDRVLKEATSAWRAQLRETDLLARYGGEEFAALLLGCSAAEAFTAVERLRAFTPLGQTFSAGIAEWDGREDPGRLVHRADVALYEAKRGGRDRVVSATPGAAGAEQPSHVPADQRT
jgi:diguanylate cyclase (GGDEF)-like protein